MNILKKINLRQKLELTRSYFKEYVFVKKSLVAIGVSLVLSLIIVQTIEPKFYVSAVLREASSSNKTMSNPSSGSVGGLLSLIDSSSDENSYEEILSNMKSYVVAQRLWEKGWGSKVFGNGQLEKEYFNKISKKHSITERLGALILGYQLHQYYSAHDLQAYINQILSLRKDIRQTNITVSMLSSDKEFAIEFLQAVILETDNYAKEYLIAKSNQIILASFEQLAVSKNSSISAALSSTINREYFNIASLDNDLPHIVYFIDPPHSSEYPVTPNLAAILLSTIIVSLFLSTMHSFVLQNKDELW